MLLTGRLRSPQTCISAGSRIRAVLYPLHKLALHSSSTTDTEQQRMLWATNPPAPGKPLESTGCPWSRQSWGTPCTPRTPRTAPHMHPRSCGWPWAPPAQGMQGDEERLAPLLSLGQEHQSLAGFDFLWQGCILMQVNGLKGQINRVSWLKKQLYLLVGIHNVFRLVTPKRGQVEGREGKAHWAQVT